MAPSPTEPSASQPAKPQRSPAERVLVWGGILVLLVLVGMQARARLGYNKTLEALQDRMSEDEGLDAKPLKVADLNDYVFGWPARKEESKGKHLSTIELTWSGLPMTKPLGLVVGYDPEEEGGTVMALETSGFVEPEPKVAPPPFSKEEAARFGDNIPAGAPGGPPAGDEPNPPAAAAAEPAPTIDPPPVVEAAPTSEPVPTTEPAPIADPAPVTEPVPEPTTEPAPATEPAAADSAPAEQPTETPSAEPAPAEQPAAPAESTSETPPATEAPATDKPAEN